MTDNTQAADSTPRKILKIKRLHYDDTTSDKLIQALGSDRIESLEILQSSDNECSVLVTCRTEGDADSLLSTQRDAPFKIDGENIRLFPNNRRQSSGKPRKERQPRAPRAAAATNADEQNVLYVKNPRRIVDFQGQLLEILKPSRVESITPAGKGSFYVTLKSKAFADEILDFQADSPYKIGDVKLRLDRKRASREATAAPVEAKSKGKNQAAAASTYSLRFTRIPSDSPHHFNKLFEVINALRVLSLEANPSSRSVEVTVANQDVASAIHADFLAYAQSSNTPIRSSRPRPQNAKSAAAAETAAAPVAAPKKGKEPAPKRAKKLTQRTGAYLQVTGPRASTADWSTSATIADELNSLIGAPDKVATIYFESNQGLIKFHTPEDCAEVYARLQAGKRLQLADGSQLRFRVYKHPTLQVVLKHLGYEPTQLSVGRVPRKLSPEEFVAQVGQAFGTDKVRDIQPNAFRGVTVTFASAADADAFFQRFEAEPLVISERRVRVNRVPNAGNI